MSVPYARSIVNVRFTDRVAQESCAEWDAFWRDARHTHPRQHRLAGDVERAKGRRAVFATAETDGRPAGVAVLSLRPLAPGGTLSAEGVCVRGPVFDDVEVGRVLLREIVERLTSLRVGRIRVAPHWMYPEAAAVESLLLELGFAPVDGAADGGAPRDRTGWVDLTRDGDAILASFSSSTRKEIRLAERRGVVVRPLTEAWEADAAYRCIASRRRAQGLTPVGRREFDATFDRVYRDGDLGVLFGAMIGRRLLGALAVLRSANLAHPSLYSVDPDAGRATRNLNIGSAIFWPTFLWAKAAGCTHLDIEGNVVPLDPSHPRYEYENFKRRFAPEPKERLPEYALVCRPAVWACHRYAARVPNLCRLAASRALRLVGRGRRGVSRTRPVSANSALGGSCP